MSPREIDEIIQKHEEHKKLYKQSNLSYTECKRLNLPTCHSQKDGDCNWLECPQLRDNEPKTTGRHCPYDWDREQDYE